MEREPYRILEDAIDDPENDEIQEIEWCKPDTIFSMLLHGVDEKVEKIKIRLSQKDCEECGKSKLQKENMDFFEGRFLCKTCWFDLQ